MDTQLGYRVALVPLNLTLTFKQTDAEEEDEELVPPAHANNDATSCIFSPQGKAAD